MTAITGTFQTYSSFTPETPIRAHALFTNDASPAASSHGFPLRFVTSPHLRRGAFRMAGFAPTGQIVHVHESAACLDGNDVGDLLGRPARIDTKRLAIQDT